MKRRKQYRRTQGHRQEQTQLLVTSLTDGAAKKTEVSAADKKVTMAKFFSNLKPKGPASQAKTLGSRKKMNVAKKAASIAAKSGAAPKVAKAKPAAAKTAPKKA